MSTQQAVYPYRIVDAENAVTTVFLGPGDVVTYAAYPRDAGDGDHCIVNGVPRVMSHESLTRFERIPLLATLLALAAAAAAGSKAPERSL